MTAPKFRIVKRRGDHYKILRLHGYRTDGRPSYRSEPVRFWFYTRDRAEDWVQHQQQDNQRSNDDMSNVERVQLIYSAFSRGDVTAILERLSDSVEWE